MTSADLEPRLVNWGDCWRARLGLDRNHAASAEGSYRNRWRASWDSDPVVGCAPIPPRQLDHADADAIEFAVCAIDLFHHQLLKAFYVRRIGPIGMLNYAREQVGEPERAYSSFAEAEHECLARLKVARSLVQMVLALSPRQRWTQTSDGVRRELGLEPLIRTG